MEEGPDEAPFLYRAQRSISDDVIAMGDYLDNFFGDARIEESHRSSLLKVSTIFEAGEDVDTDVRVRASLKYVLPKFENRFNLIIGREPPAADQVTENLAERGLSSRLSDPDEASYTSALRYILADRANWESDLDGGLKIRSNPVWFSQFRLTRKWNLDPWALRLTHKLFWFDDDGLGSNSRLDLERKLGPHRFFRTSVAGTWLEERDGLILDQVFTHIWTRRPGRATALQTVVVGETRPHTQVLEYNLNVKYRRQLKQKWLFLEIQPELAFPRERDYEPTVRGRIQLQYLFGDVKFWE